MPPVAPPPVAPPPVAPPPAARFRPAAPVVVHELDDLADADVVAVIEGQLPASAGVLPRTGAGSARTAATVLAADVRRAAAAAFAAHDLGARALALLAR